MIFILDFFSATAVTVIHSLLLDYYNTMMYNSLLNNILIGHTVKVNSDNYRVDANLHSEVVPYDQATDISYFPS